MYLSRCFFFISLIFLCYRFGFCIKTRVFFNQYWAIRLHLRIFQIFVGLSFQDRFIIFQERFMSVCILQFLIGKFPPLVKHSPYYLSHSAVLTFIYLLCLFLAFFSLPPHIIHVPFSWVLSLFFSMEFGLRPLLLVAVKFGLVWLLLNGISTFLGYSMPNISI